MRPTEVKILGIPVEIKYLPESEMKGNFGLADLNRYEILIDDSLSCERERNTLLHEILHHAEYGSQLNLTERQVTVLANVLIAIFKDNEQLVDYIFKGR